MKRTCIFLSLCSILFLSVSLSGCSDVNISNLPEGSESKEMDTEEWVESLNENTSEVVASEETIPKEITSDEVSSGSTAQIMEIVEDAFVLDPSGNPINKKEIADRVLFRFQNQILEWYCSDVHLQTGIPYGKNENTIRDVDLTPGNKLYYQVLSSSGTNTFQVRCSDVESFDQFFTREYAYLAGRGEVTEFKITKIPNQLIASGEFIIPETFFKSDDREYLFVNEEFHALWNNWLSQKASTDLKTPLKAAYLMPFSVEEDGSADMCVFLEFENGAWVMARPSIVGYHVIEDAEPSFFERKVGWGYSHDYILVTPHFLSEEDISFKTNLLESELAVFRAYEPTESGYIVHSYESEGTRINNSVVWYDPERNMTGGGLTEPKNGDFLSRIPDLAEEKLY